MILNSLYTTSWCVTMGRKYWKYIKQSLHCSICSLFTGLAPAMSKLEISPSKGSVDTRKWPIPKRKVGMSKLGTVGTRGRLTQVEVNHLALSFSKTGTIIHYDCAFEPDKPKKMLRWDLVIKFRLKYIIIFSWICPVMLSSA